MRFALLRKRTAKLSGGGAARIREHLRSKYANGIHPFMQKNRMMDSKRENTIGGGEAKQMSEIKLGEATYIVHRFYSDARSVPELIMNRLLKEKNGKSAFDEGTDDAV